MNEYRHMMMEYFIKRTREIYKERKKRVNKIRSLNELEKYQEEITRKIKEAFYPLPEKTPLNTKITGIIKKKNFRIEKLIFESRPGCLVTANLYIPERLKPPFPAVVKPCGHTIEGKGYPVYQEVCQRLVNNGFMALIYDPFSQGERDQYVKLPEHSYLRTRCTHAHNTVGKQMKLIGEFFGSWRLWDGIRAIDYIVSREEWDKKFLGITGVSGGGTLTTWLWAIDRRLTAAAPSCFITPFLYNLENELPQDAEQYPPGIIGDGLELADFFISRIPSPLILLGEKYDFFDIRGFYEIVEEIKSFYSYSKCEDNFQYYVGNNPHEYYPEAQKVMVSFFCKIAKRDIINLEPEIEIEKPHNLYATEKGNVIKAGSKPVYILVREIADIIIKNREQSNGEIKEKIRRLLKIPERIEKIPHYRVLRPIYKKDGITGRYAVETEENIWVILKKKMVYPEKVFYLECEEEINLYIPDIYSEEKKSIKLKKDTPLYFVEVRGTGESIPSDKKNFLNSYGYDYMFDGWYLLYGESYFGKRVYDVISVIELIKTKGCRKINLYGNGQGGLIGLFVSLFTDIVDEIFIKDVPASFYSLLQTHSPELPSSGCIRDIIKITDIPEIVNNLQKKGIKLNLSYKT